MLGKISLVEVEALGPNTVINPDTITNGIINSKAFVDDEDEEEQVQLPDHFLFPSPIFLFREAYYVLYFMKIVLLKKQSKGVRSWEHL